MIELKNANNTIKIDKIEPSIELIQVGKRGAGVKEGGATGQILAKNSDIDYDTIWIDKADIQVTGPKGDKGDTGSQGPIGLTGPKGDVGPQGPIGLTGPKGDTGDKGNTGSAGEQGTKGDTGEQGPQGLQGIQGVKGDTGAQGIQGETGPKGDKGDKGDQGVQGVQGIKGDTGSTGPKGDTGSTGPKGDTGEQGDAGPAGPSDAAIYTTVEAISDIFTADISLAQLKNLSITLSDAVSKTIIFSNVPSGRCEIFLELVVSTLSAVIWTLNTGSTLAWSTGSAPNLSAGKTYRLLFMTNDSGATWDGFASVGV